jgi:hypothetical protein
MGGNTNKLTVKDSFVSTQCLLDFVVLLIRHYKDTYSHLPVPLHLTGLDYYEIFVSKIGGMCGMKWIYDFHELQNCANVLNHLAAIEYG